MRFPSLLIAAALIVIPLRGEEAEDSRLRARKDSLEMIDLRIERNGWGDADWNDLSAVLHSSCGELAVHFEKSVLSRLEPIRIRNAEAGPMTCYDRTVRGEILVLLDSNNRFWCQHAYQMAHEFCHVLCRTKKADRSNLWFEESICELASIFALRQMAHSWETRPPYPNWRAYSKSLDKYSGDLIKKYSLPASVSLESWYQSNAVDLKSNATDRTRNGKVAVRLLPLFEKAPSCWRAIHYLNNGTGMTPQPFTAYLKAWHQNCPDELKPFVAQIGLTFGISITN